MGYKEYDEYGTRLLEYDDNNNLIHSKEKCGFLKLGMNTMIEVIKSI